MKHFIFSCMLLALAPLTLAQEEPATVTLNFDALASGDHEFSGTYSELPHLLFGVGYEEDFDWYRRAILDSDYDIYGVASLMESMEDVFSAVGASLVKDVTNLELTDIAPGLEVSSSFESLGSRRGGAYTYMIQQQHNGNWINVIMKLSFPTQTPVVTAVNDSENYRLYADDFTIESVLFSLSNDNAGFTMDPAHAKLTINSMEVEMVLDNYQMEGVNVYIKGFEADLQGSLIEEGTPITGTMEGAYSGVLLNVDTSGFYNRLKAEVQGARMETHLSADGVHESAVAGFDEDMYPAVTIIRKLGGAVSGVELFFLGGLFASILLWRRRKA